MKCLEIIVSGQKIKRFDESVLNTFWDCLHEIITNFPSATLNLDRDVKHIFRKLGEINQEWLLMKIIAFIKTTNEVETLKTFLNFASGLKLKVK